MWNWFKNKEKPKLNYYNLNDKVYFMGKVWQVEGFHKWSFEDKQYLKLIIRYGCQSMQTTANNTEVKPVVRAYAVLV